MKFKQILINSVLSLALFCSSFYLAWLISVQNNFLYSTWYEVLDIQKTIERYGPQNKFRDGFEKLDKAEHVQLFNGIVKAIQNNGNGLEKLEYTKTNSKEKLLTNAEVIHLQDVANLITKIKYSALAGFITVAVLLGVMFLTNVAISTLRAHLLGGVGVIILLTVLIFIVGPTNVFYWGHELIFPDNHQWFFYYEESLMSTMMKAPVLFGPIALQLLFLTMLLWIMFLVLIRKMTNSIA